MSVERLIAWDGTPLIPVNVPDWVIETINDAECCDDVGAHAWVVLKACFATSEGAA